MSYQLVNTTEILPIATSHLAHLCNQFNCGLALGLKIVIFAKKAKLSSAATVKRTQQSSPPLQISGYTLGQGWFISRR